MVKIPSYFITFTSFLINFTTFLSPEISSVSGSLVLSGLRIVPPCTLSISAEDSSPTAMLLLACATAAQSLSKLLENLFHRFLASTAPSRHQTQSCSKKREQRRLQTLQEVRFRTIESYQVNKTDPVDNFRFSVLQSNLTDQLDDFSSAQWSSLLLKDMRYVKKIHGRLQNAKEVRSEFRLTLTRL